MHHDVACTAKGLQSDQYKVQLVWNETINCHKLPQRRKIKVDQQGLKKYIAKKAQMIFRKSVIKLMAQYTAHGTGSALPFPQGRF